jgi:hypothetical protein
VYGLGRSQRGGRTGWGRRDGDVSVLGGEGEIAKHREDG